MRKRKSKSPESGPKLGRRAFVGTMAATSFGLMGAAGQPGHDSREAGAGQKPILPTTSSVQASSKVAGGRGMVLRAQVDYGSGIPLGGIGTGSVEIRPDGYFHDWMIFNLSDWSDGLDDQDPAISAQMTPDAFPFFLRVLARDGKPVVRRLGMRFDQFTARKETVWAKNVEAIEFEGNFPMATLRYLDSSLPVTVTGRFFSALTPHDARTSGTPGFYASFHFRNTSHRPVELSLAATLRNPLAQGASDRKLRTTVQRDGETAYLTMRMAAQDGQTETLSSLCLSVTGGEPSWIGADFSPYLGNGYDVNSGLADRRDPVFSMRFPTFLRDFRQTGKLPDLEADENPAPRFPADPEGVAKLSLDEVKSLIARAGRVSSLKYNVDMAAHVDPNFLTDERLMRLLVMDLCRNLNTLAGAPRGDRTWGDAALSSTVRLAPGEEKEICFTLGWYFPHHVFHGVIDLGHMYERWFRDAEEVNRFLVSGRPEHLATASAFVRTMMETNLDPELAFCWAAQLTTLVKNTWWSRNGRFGVWEGLACCGVNTLDIVYQASFPAMALYPDLELKEMEAQHASGRIHGSFFPDLATPRRVPGTGDTSEGLADVNPQLVMLICRDYLWTGDAGFLKRMWPCVLTTMQTMEPLDVDGDGLPVHDVHRVTYDQWNPNGSPSYVCSLWLGALEAGIRMAEDLGESAQAEEWRAALHKVVSAFESKLWNGEYYSFWVDGERRDENCMADQLSGMWFANLIGLGHALPRERILAALEAIVRYNFDPEQGCQNGAYPPGRKPLLPSYENYHALSCFTGIEYAVSSMLIDFGMPQQGVDVARAVHDRYLRAGSCWNHNECGVHYHRAMASWATLLAATGFKPDAPRRTLTIAPMMSRPELRAPWVHTTGWGQFVASSNRFELLCHSGTVSFAVLRLKPPGLRAAMLNGRALACKPVDEDGLSVLRFASPVEVRAGQRLVITEGVRG
jgi:uncharacterized protein (DUF608 family)